MRKKLIAKVMFLVILVSVCAGCGSGNDETGGQAVQLETQEISDELNQVFTENSLENWQADGYLFICKNDDWQLDEAGQLTYSDNPVAMVSEVEDFEYGSSSKSIVSNWLGMHYSIIEESEIALNAGDEAKLMKVLVKVEPTPAQAYEGKTAYEELHYFYVEKNKQFIDIQVLDELYLDELEFLFKNM